MSSPEESDDSTKELVIPPEYSGEKLLSSLISESAETGTADAGGDASENSIVANEITSPNNENNENVENDEDVSHFSEAEKGLKQGKKSGQKRTKVTNENGHLVKKSKNDVDLLIQKFCDEIQKKIKQQFELQGATIKNQKSPIKKLCADVEELGPIIKDLSAHFEKQDAFIKKLDVSIKEQVDVMKKLDVYIKKQDVTIKNLDITMKEQGDAIEQQDANIEKQGATIKEQDATIKKQDATIKSMVEELQQMRQFQQQLLQIYPQTGVVFNQPFPNKYDASNQQSVSETPSIPVSSKVALHQPMSNDAYPSVHLLDQQSIQALIQGNFDHGLGSNQKTFNPPVVSSLVPYTAADRALSNTGTGSYQQMRNPSLPSATTNQQIPNFPSNKLMLSAASAHSFSVPSSRSAPVQSQPNQYYQHLVSNSGAASNLSLSSMCDASIKQLVSATPNLPVSSLLRQHTFNYGDRPNQQMVNEPVKSSPVSEIESDEVLSYANIGSFQQMENPFFVAKQQIPNLSSNQLMFNPPTAHSLSMPTSVFVSTQPQLDQYYHRSVLKSGSFMQNGTASNQPLHNTNGASVQQLVSLTHDLPVSLEDALNQRVQNTAFPSVQQANQELTTALSCSNDGVKSNQLTFGAPIGFSQTPKSGLHQELSKISVRSCQEMANLSATSNQQILNLPSTQLTFNTSTTHRVSVPTASSVSMQPQSNQYQSSMSNLDATSNQPLQNRCGASVEQLISLTPNLPVSLRDTLNHSMPDTTFSSVQPADQQLVTALSCLNDRVKSNQLTHDATVGSSQTSNDSTDQGLSNISVGSYQQMVNPFITTSQQIPNFYPTQLIFDTATTHGVSIPTSSSLSMQSQSNQYQVSMSNSGAASNQPLHNTNGASGQQLVSLIHDHPVSLEDELNQILPNTASPSVQPADQQSIKLPSGQSLNDGVNNNQLTFDATVGSSQTPNTGSDQRLSNISVGSYQQMANPSVGNSKQISNLRSTQLILNTATTQTRSNTHLQYLRSANLTNSKV